MSNLSSRAETRAGMLGSISLLLLVISFLAELASVHLNSFALDLPASLLALVSLALGIWAMVVRRSCIHPRPLAPILALAASVIGCVFYACLFVFFMSAAGHQ